MEAEAGAWTGAVPTDEVPFVAVESGSADLQQRKLEVAWEVTIVLIDLQHDDCESLRPERRRQDKAARLPQCMTISAERLLPQQAETGCIDSYAVRQHELAHFSSARQAG